MFSGCLVRYSTYSTYSKEPGESGCSVACLVRYSTYSTYSKEPGESEGSAGWRSVRAAFCMVFAWFLQHVEQLVFCMVFATCGTACFFAWFLHDMWNSLFFCMTCGTACFLHDTWNSLHGFACHVHVVQPRAPPPCFFLSGCRRSDILVNFARRGGAERAPNQTCRAGTLPSGHLTKRAEQAQCRAGT